MAAILTAGHRAGYKVMVGDLPLDFTVQEPFTHLHRRPSLCSSLRVSGMFLDILAIGVIVCRSWVAMFFRVRDWRSMCMVSVLAIDVCG